MVKSVRKLVIPSAGMGNRLLPSTKEIPTEMMPNFTQDSKKRIFVKPLIQILFEQFFSKGIHEYCIIVGKQKRAIEDHFTPDNSLLSNLSPEPKKLMQNFFKKLKSSRIFWINQYEAKGFGDAVLTAETFVGDDDFLVSAGDTLVPFNGTVIEELMTTDLAGKNDALIILKKVSNPKRFGVAVVKKQKTFFQVINVEEKPKKPKSNLAIVALYRFKPSIFSALKSIKPKGELQLTDGIQKLIEQGGSVRAIILSEKQDVIDIGTPDSYLEILKKSSPLKIT